MKNKGFSLIFSPTVNKHAPYHIKQTSAEYVLNIFWVFKVDIHTIENVDKE